jgi:ABC-2 type transport system permease protein
VRRNPVLDRELKLRMRERYAFWVPALYVGTLAFLFGQAYAPAGYPGMQPWALGRSVFASMATSSLILIALVTPIFAAGAITIEKEQKTLSSLLMSRLSSAEIVLGKLQAAVLYVLWVALTGLPLLLICYLLGGVTTSSVLLHYVSAAGLTVLLAALGLCFSTFFKRSMFAIAANYGFLALALTLTLFVVAYLRQLESILEVALMDRVAFLSPLFFLNDAARGQWPCFLGVYLGLGYLCLRWARRQLTRRAFPL